MNSIYTKSERTDKKYTVGQAIDTAKRRLKGKPICLDAISGRDLAEKITLEELNKIQENLYYDSIFYG